MHILTSLVDQPYWPKLNWEKDKWCLWLLEGSNHKDFMWMAFAEIGMTILHALWQLMRHTPKNKGKERMCNEASSSIKI